MKPLPKTLLLSFILALPTAIVVGDDASSSVIPVARDGNAAERFQLLNERVASNQGELDVLFIGDSITQGWERAGEEVWNEFYGARRALNIGIGGDRTQHVLWRLENGNIDGLAPKVTVIMIGTNNSADSRNTAGEMLEGVQAVVSRVQEKLPETKILLLGIFPRGRDFNDQRGKILQVTQALQNLHDGQRVYFLDFGHIFLAPDGSIPREIMHDALHLSTEGYRMWAEAMEPTLTALLEEEQQPTSRSSLRRLRRSL